MTFFRRVGKKLALGPSTDAERTLMRKLDQAFAKDFAPRSEPGFVAWMRDLEILRFAPVAMAGALVIILGQQIEHTQPKPDAPVAFAFASDDIEASWLNGSGDQPEFYENMEDWMLTASDEDWDAILEKSG